jgi:hypothetical protein
MMSAEPRKVSSERVLQELQDQIAYLESRAQDARTAAFFARSDEMRKRYQNMARELRNEADRLRLMAYRNSS